MPRPRTIKLALVASSAAALSLAASAALGQVSGTWNLQWNVISGGGGLSSQDPYAVRGVVGQAVAGGPSTAGSYAVSSGFFAGSGDIKFKAFLPQIAKQP